MGPKIYPWGTPCFFSPKWIQYQYYDLRLLFGICRLSIWEWLVTESVWEFKGVDFAGQMWNMWQLMCMKETIINVKWSIY